MGYNTFIYECNSIYIGVEEYCVNRRILKIAALLVMAMLLVVPAIAENMISTTLVMRVSHMTQNAVVDAGEDLTMEVSVDGAVPASYQWYFNDQPIEGANQKVYSIVNAQVEDAGIYRMDAFDAEEKMVVSMDISARVIDKTVPKSGDDSLPVQYVLAVMGSAAVVLTMTLRRRTAA